MKNAFFLFFLFSALQACQPTAKNTTTTYHQNSKPLIDEAAIAQIFDREQAHGTFVLHEFRSDQWIVYNPERADSAFLPASTFKIPNSLIALETGVLKDENEVLPWDGVERQIKAWNKDHNLRSAIEVSAVWFYQEVARRVGQEQMQHWVDRLQYGNQNIGGGIDLFWLTGDLRINARQQIAFLEKLYQNQLPCRPETMATVKDILIREKTDRYVLRAKTGWADADQPNLGWYVGWLEEGDKMYFFAMNLDIYKSEDAAKRYKITTAVFEQMGLLKK